MAFSNLGPWRAPGGPLQGPKPTKAAAENFQGPWRASGGPLQGPILLNTIDRSSAPPVLQICNEADSRALFVWWPNAGLDPSEYDLLSKTEKKANHPLIERYDQIPKFDAESVRGVAMSCFVQLWMRWMTSIGVSRICRLSRIGIGGRVGGGSPSLGFIFFGQKIREPTSQIFPHSRVHAVTLSSGKERNSWNGEHYRSSRPTLPGY